MTIVSSSDPEERGAASALVTSSRRARPYRPFAVRCLNAMGPVLGALGLARSFDPDELMARAQRKTGLSDFGEAHFRAPMQALLRAIEGEARLNFLGRLVQHGRIVSALCTRLRAEALIAQHPDILDRKLGPMLVIAGLQRTGTTLLHRLLASAPGARAIHAWEALSPVPHESEGREGSAVRRRLARRAERGLAYLAPDFFAIHPVEFDAPEEDVLLLDVAFASQAPEAIMHVPSYATFLERWDHAPAYRHFRRLLLLLDWQRSGSPWILKTPNHLEHFDILADVFPEATIVQTHRDPHKTMPSFCSMVAHGRAVFSDHVDRHEVGRHWLRKAGRMVTRAMSARDRLAKARFVDVAYADLVRDPVAEIARIYDCAGLSLSENARKAMERARKHNVRHKYGRHLYRAEDFGLTRASIEAALGAYAAAFAIAHEEETP